MQITSRSERKPSVSLQGQRKTSGSLQAQKKKHVDHFKVRKTKWITSRPESKTNESLQGQRKTRQITSRTKKNKQITSRTENDNGTQVYIHFNWTWNYAKLTLFVCYTTNNCFGIMQS